jgi:hypothetical protein
MPFIHPLGFLNRMLSTTSSTMRAFHSFNSRFAGTCLNKVGPSCPPLLSSSSCSLFQPGVLDTGFSNAVSNFPTPLIGHTGHPSLHLHPSKSSLSKTAKKMCFIVDVVHEASGCILSETVCMRNQQQESTKAPVKEHRDKPATQAWRLLDNCQKAWRRDSRKQSRGCSDGNVRDGEKASRGGTLEDVVLSVMNGLIK